MKGIVLAALVATEFTAAVSAATIDQNWESRFVRAPGLDGDAYAMLAIGTNLYVGGAFTTVGIPDTRGIARWDGAKWTSVGGGIAGPVIALTTDGTSLFAGGIFNSAGGVAATNVAKWDGTNWASIGALHFPDSQSTYIYHSAVYCLHFDGTNLFAGGTFFQAGGVLATNIARWDGVTWHALGNGLGTAEEWEDFLAVYDVAKHENYLYAVGRFPISGNTGVTNFARWNGAAWEQVGGGLNGGRQGVVWRGGEYYGHGQALCSTKDGLLVGGDFTFGGSPSTTNLALWNGTNWISTGAGSDQPISRFITDGTNQIVLGSFSHIGGIAAEGVAQLSGGNWSALGSGVASAGIAGSRIGSNLYVGGSFQIAGGQSAGFIARWNGMNWQPLIAGEATAPSDWVGSVAFGADGYLYAAGGFQTAGKVRVNGVARYDGTNWTGFGNGFPERNVQAVALIGTNVYVKGYFNRPANGITNLARWNGSDWVALGLGLGNDGYAPIIDGFAAGTTNLFVSGYFKTAGGMPATNLANWDGSQWHAIPSPPSTLCGGDYVMNTRGDELYICQQGSCFFGDPVQLQIKKWNGVEWTDVSLPLAITPFTHLPEVYPRTQVESLLFLGTQVFVAGHFAVTNGLVATNLICWDGVSWSGVDYPFEADAVVSPLTTDGTNLFVVINRHATPMDEIKIAKWNGTNWKVLGTGVTSSRGGAGVSSLAMRGRDLFVGGYFNSAGGKPADNLALWHDFPEVTLSGRGWQPNGHFGLSISGGQGQLVQLQTSTNLQTWTSQGIIQPNSEPFLWDDSSTSTNAVRFYRLLLFP